MEKPETVKKRASLSNRVASRVFNLGEQGSGFRAYTEVQDFYELREDCLKKKRLFEDPAFPAEESSLFFSKRGAKKFEWKRPHQISNHPKLFVGGASRFDVLQGELGDCWLLAAMANLTLFDNLFKYIVPVDQSFKDKYAGIFHFRFWQYGKWVDIVIDDRLPTFGGKLVFLHSSDPDEFWSALVEKAYAKLHGSYEALKGGSTCEAMEDCTGGVTELFELKDAPSNLYRIMTTAFKRLSLMGCSIDPGLGAVEARTKEGLIKGHAYSITSVNQVSLGGGYIPLIRIRNPWGDAVEWNGAWSDKSQEWKLVSDKDKKKIGLVFQRDGEFWMNFKDFLKYFTRVEICNLSPESMDTEEGHHKRQWETSMYEGEWVQGVTAGGCRNFLETFWHNPQYRITLKDPDEEDDDNTCSIIVALMQKNRRIQRKKGMDSLSIGFTVYHLKNPNKLPTPLDLNFFKYNASVARTPNFMNLREVTCRFKLPEGVYCIVPTTYEPNQEGEFLLRVFSENKAKVEEHDEQIGLGTVDVKKLYYQLLIKYSQLPKTMPEKLPKMVEDYKNKYKDKASLPEIILYIFKIISKPTSYDEKTQKVKAFFCQIAGEDMEVDWRELKKILDYSTYRDKRPVTFSSDVCRSMIAMYDQDQTGQLGFDEFHDLWNNICQWKTVFKLFDNGSGFIGAFELRQALNSAGYSLNNHVLNILVHRYSSKKSMISFDDFMMCAVKLKSMIDRFQSKDTKGTGKATFTIGEWIEITLYS